MTKKLEELLNLPDAKEIVNDAKKEDKKQKKEVIKKSHNFLTNIIQHLLVFLLMKWMLLLVFLKNEDLVQMQQ